MTSRAYHIFTAAPARWGNSAALEHVMTIDISPSGLSGPPPSDHAALRAAADGMEAAFLAEMFKSAGLGAPRDSFGGGAGEEQFGSFLREAQAAEMVRAGGIGLSESIFRAMLRGQA